MSRISKIKYNNKTYDISALIENIVLSDMSYDEDEIKFIVGVLKWKESVVDIPNNKLVLNTYQIDMNVYKYSLSSLYINENKFFDLNGNEIKNFEPERDGIDKIDIINLCPNLSLKEMIEYLLNENDLQALDISILDSIETPDDLSGCTNIYQVIKFFNSKCVDRVQYITDYSYGVDLVEQNKVIDGYNNYIPPRTNHPPLDTSKEYWSDAKNEEIDVDIVMTAHSSHNEDAKTSDVQTVRIYREDGAVELGKSYASGAGAFAASGENIASGKFSAAFGEGTTANIDTGFAVGSYNNSNIGTTFVVGIGDKNSEKNGFYITPHGDAWINRKTIIEGNDNPEDKKTLIIKNADTSYITNEGDIYTVGKLEVKKDGDIGNNLKVATNSRQSEETAFNVNNGKFTADIYGNIKNTNDDIIHGKLRIGDKSAEFTDKILEEHPNWEWDGEKYYENTIPKEGERTLRIKNDNDNYQFYVANGKSYFKDSIIESNPDKKDIVQIEDGEYEGNKLYLDSYIHNTYPTADMEYDLGQGIINGQESDEGQELRWKKLWVKDIDASGDVNVKGGLTANNVKADAIDVNSRDDGIVSSSADFVLSANIIPSQDNYYSIGRFDRRWQDGYFSGRLFGDSAYLSNITLRNGSSLRIKSAYEVEQIKQTGDAKGTFKDGYLKDSKKSIKDGAKPTFPEITIDFMTGRLYFYWSGYTTSPDTSKDNCKWKTDGMPIKIFDEESIILKSLNKDIHLTGYVYGVKGDANEVDCLIRCANDFVPNTSTSGTGVLDADDAEDSNAYLNSYEWYKVVSQDNADTAKETVVNGERNNIFINHSLYKFAKRYGYPRSSISHYYKQREKLLNSDSYLKGLKDKKILNSNTTDGKAGWIHMKLQNGNWGGNKFVVMQGYIDTGLDYDDLVFIKKLNDKGFGKDNIIEQEERRNSIFELGISQNDIYQMIKNDFGNTLDTTSGATPYYFDYTKGFGWSNESLEGDQELIRIMNENVSRMRDKIVANKWVDGVNWNNITSCRHQINDDDGNYRYYTLLTYIEGSNVLYFGKDSNKLLSKIDEEDVLQKTLDELYAKYGYTDVELQTENLKI